MGKVAHNCAVLISSLARQHECWSVCLSLSLHRLWNAIPLNDYKASQAICSLCLWKWERASGRKEERRRFIYCFCSPAVWWRLHRIINRNMDVCACVWDVLRWWIKRRTPFPTSSFYIITAADATWWDCSIFDCGMRWGGTIPSRW